MPLMNTFCTWLPLRLGSIIVGLISMKKELEPIRIKILHFCYLNIMPVVLVSIILMKLMQLKTINPSIFPLQSILMEIICILSLNMTDTISHEINKLLRSNNMVYTTEILKAVEKDPRTYLSNIMFYFSLHTISCGALIYGALKSSIFFILPFVILELIRLIAVFYIVLTSMILIKINVLDFLVLILISVIGVFLLQILIYLWCCPVSLVQCLILVKKSESQESFETNNIIVLPKTIINNQDVVYDPLSDHYGWRPFRPSYSYPYENMPQYEY